MEEVSLERNVRSAGDSPAVELPALSKVEGSSPALLKAERKSSPASAPNISKPRPRRSLSFHFQAFACFLFFALPATSLLGTNARPTEYQVEAAYLFNFGKFVDWPPNHADAQSGPLVICVLGDDPFGSSLDSMLRQGTVKGRQLAARRIGRIEDAVGCQMLYISASESERVDRILSGVGGNSVLTVSDLPKFTDRGGMIQFLREDGRVRFQINLGAAENAGLVVSSELLKVAVTVKRK